MNQELTSILERIGPAVDRQIREQLRIADLEENRNCDVTSPDVACLSWWFPRILRAGVPVPVTRYVALSEVRSLAKACYDGHRHGHDALGSLCGLLRLYAEDVGYPCFLRTGHFSGKHNWKKTCFVEKPEDFESHAAGLAYMQEMCGVAAQSPLSVWAVRRMLPTRPAAVCRDYGDFPLVRELRAFVTGSRVDYWNPYWPTQAVQDGRPSRPAGEVAGELQAFGDDELAEILSLAARCGEACEGPGCQSWSVDVLETDEGWYVTDMAPAQMSYGFDPARRPQDEGGP